MLDHIGEFDAARARTRWIRGHQVFVPLMSAVALALAVTRRAAHSGTDADARLALDAAAGLLFNTCAAFRFTGGITQRAYAEVLRPAMVRVAPEFSGTWCADHAAVLAELRQALQPLTSPVLRASVTRLRQAIDASYRAHAAVCQEATGTASSLLDQKRAAAGAGHVELVERRRPLVLARCPVNHR